MSGPAHNYDAEATVLGSLLRWPDLDAEHDLHSEEMFDARHRAILGAVRRLPRERPCTPVAVGEALLASGELAAIGGVPYLLELIDGVATQVGFGHHAAIVRQHAQRRGLEQLALDLAIWARDLDADPLGLVELVERRLLAVTRSETPAAHEMPELIAAVHADLVRRMEGRAPGLPTGLAALDDVTRGVRPGELVVVAGRPGMGKTAMGLAVGRRIAGLDHGLVAVFSLEMAAEALAARLVAAEARVNLRAIRARMPDNEWGRILRAEAVLHDLPMRLYDGPRLTIDGIASQCRRLAARGDLALVVIDHAGLVRGHGELRERMVDTSHGARAIAKECRCPVLLLAQLNRDCEKRADKRPQLSDLKESGSLEEDADQVWLLYRDDYYRPETLDKAVIEVNVAKQRDGPTDTVKLAYIAGWTRVDNLAVGR